MNKLVSIVIPMFNAEKYIEATIQSVLDQTYTNWELLIIDDCSTDKSRELVESYVTKNSKIKLLLSKENFGGPARPRNIGIKNAKGSYIAFLDADDLWKKEKLEKQMVCMQKNKISFCATQIQEFDGEGEIYSRKVRIRQWMERYRKVSLCRLLGDNILALSSVIVVKDKLPFFNEDKRFIAVEDYGMWLELFYDQSIIYMMLQERLVDYRVVNDSISERGQIYKQDIKAKLLALEFINKKELFHLYPCAVAGKIQRLLYSFRGREQDV